MTIGGVHYATDRPDLNKKILHETLRIVDRKSHDASTCTFTTKGFEPADRAEVFVSLGSDRIFGGNVRISAARYVGTPANAEYDCTCSDFTVGMDHLKVLEQYTGWTATAIILDILAKYCPGYSPTGVDPNLPVIDEITFTVEDPTACLTRVMKRIGGDWRCTYDKVIRAYLEDTEDAPTDLTASHPTLDSIEIERDSSGLITRALVEGYGSTALETAAVGASEIAVVDGVFYDPDGGHVRSGQQIIDYSGLDYGYTTDLATWASQTATGAINWAAVTWAAGLALFVAVGSSDMVMTSPDGVTWTQRTAILSDWSAVAWSPELALLVAVSNSGKIMTSLNGSTWTERTSPEANIWNGVVWSPEQGQFVIVGSSGTHRALTSPDGVTWTARTAVAGSWLDVTWAAALGLYVAVGSNGANGVMTSPDGITWTQRADVNNFTGVAWSPSLGRLIAVAPGASSTIGTSTNGTSWTDANAPNANFWNKVIWAEELGIYVAVARTGGAGSNQIMTSPDGTTWTARAAPALGLWSGVAWAPSIGTLAAVSPNGGVIQVMTNTSSFFLTLTGIPASGEGSIQHVINAGDDVNIWIVVDDLAAQAALRALEGGDGIIEDSIQDRRISASEARSRGEALIAQRSTVAYTLTYRVHDYLTAAGKTVYADLLYPRVTVGYFLISEVTISGFSETATLYPYFDANTATERFTLEELLRLKKAA